MKILNVSVKNFASYKELDFEFNGQGLTLLSGPTGAGKSTLCDVIPWCLFGKTSKNGSVDEIRSWGTTEPTEGEILLMSTNSDMINIYRSRGPGVNDLKYQKDGAPYIRGKDLADTQRMINELLGFDIDLYLSGAYFHEFSQTAQFFTTNAKNRRNITEQLVDLTMASELSENIKEYRKEVKKELTSLQQTLSIKQELCKSNETSLYNQSIKAKQWTTKHAQAIKTLQSSYDNFESDKNNEIQKIEVNQAWNANEAITLKTKASILTTDLAEDGHYNKHIKSLEATIQKLDEEKCPTCGSSAHNTKKVLVVRDLQRVKDQIHNLNGELKSTVWQLQQNTKNQVSLQEQLEQVKARENSYLSQLNKIKKESNPYNTDELQESLTLLGTEIAGLQDDITTFTVEMSDLDLLSDVNQDFRAVLVKNTIKELETNTNKLLTDHFDAEIKVSFDVEEADKLEAVILKDGNLASYTQLSKGQRALLKLCFGISVMKAVTQHHALSFNVLFFDEALDGLSETLKERAFVLFSQLAMDYESIFVVDHSEGLKSCFNNRFDVSLIDGGSKIEQA